MRHPDRCVNICVHIITLLSLPSLQKEALSVFWGGGLATLVLLLGMFPGPVFNLTMKAGNALLP